MKGRNFELVPELRNPLVRPDVRKKAPVQKVNSRLTCVVLCHFAELFFRLLGLSHLYRTKTRTCHANPLAALAGNLRAQQWHPQGSKPTGLLYASVPAPGVTNGER